MLPAASDAVYLMFVVPATNVSPGLYGTKPFKGVDVATTGTGKLTQFIVPTKAE